MLSIIIAWRDRIELNRALPSLTASARAVGGDVTVVNFSGSPGMLSEQLDGCTDDVRVVTVEDQRYFNKSCAQNLGAAHASQPFLFFCDCDIIVQDGTLPELVRALKERPGTFATLAGIRETEPNSRGGKHVVCFGYELRIRTADGRELRIVDNEEDVEDGTRQAPGLLMVRRSDFLAVQGYNSRLLGWGWEDQDMISRLTLGADLRRLCKGHALHISHDDHARVAHYPIANRWESRDKMFRQALSNYDAADFSGTYETDLRTVHCAVTQAPAS